MYFTLTLKPCVLLIRSLNNAVTITVTFYMIFIIYMENIVSRCKKILMISNSAGDQ